MNEQKQIGLSLDDVGKTLKDAEIRIEEITVDVVVPEFLDYLPSYSGLKKLTMKPGGITDVTWSNAVASEFFATSLVKHGPSLQELAIHALHE